MQFVPRNPKARGRGGAGRNDTDDGPLTNVPLTGWSGASSHKCSAMNFVPILTAFVFLADATLTVIAGLDAVDRGPTRPWIQFSFSIAVAALYTALFLAALVQHRWERILGFQYHWVLSLFVGLVLTWSNFGIWASWLTRFSSFTNGVNASDGSAFVTWIVVNGLGVAGFFVRFAVFAISQGLRYTHYRAVELQAKVVSASQGGRSLITVINNDFKPRLWLDGSRRSQLYQHRDPTGDGKKMITPSPSLPPSSSGYVRQFAGTQWSAQQRKRQNGGGSLMHH